MRTQLRTLSHTLLDFAKNPIPSINTPSTLRAKLKVMIILLLLEFILLFFLRIIIVGLSSAELISFKEHKINLLFENNSIFLSIILLVFVFPFLEELVFRLHLRLNEKYIHLNVIIFISGIILLTWPSIISFYYKIAILALGFFFILYYFINKSKSDQFILKIWNKKYFYVFYISLLAFGILHITNYNKTFYTYLLLPILILPQIITGMLCSFMRLYFDFFYGYFFHVSHNLILAIPILISTLFQLSFSNSVEIQENINNNNNNKMNYVKITNDTIVIDRLKIYDIMPRLVGLDKDSFQDYIITGKCDLIEYEDSMIADKILTIKFFREEKKPLGILKSSKSIVLYDLLKKFHLKVERKSFEKPIYHLQIIDSAKLSLHVDFGRDPLEKNKYPVWFYDSINLKNVSLNFIARTISLNYEQKVVDTLRNNLKYTMMIPKLEFEEMNKFITKQYGIKLEKSYYKVPGFRISSIN